MHLHSTEQEGGCNLHFTDQRKGGATCTLLNKVLGGNLHSTDQRNGGCNLHSTEQGRTRGVGGVQFALHQPN